MSSHPNAISERKRLFPQNEERRRQTVKRKRDSIFYLAVSQEFFYTKFTLFCSLISGCRYERGISLCQFQWPLPLARSRDDFALLFGIPSLADHDRQQEMTK